MSRWLRYRARLSQIGLRGLMLGLFEKLRNFALYRWHKFDRWHVGATYHLRPYKGQVVAIINGQHPDVVVEIGTGLGDIVSRAQAQRKIGFDIDAAAIRAARTIHRGRAEFLAVDLLQEPQRIKDCGIDHISVLVMINWLHGLPLSDIARIVQGLRQWVPVEFLLIDLIKAGPGFKYLHTMAECETLGRVESLVPGNDGVRDFALIRLQP